MTDESSEQQRNIGRVVLQFAQVEAIIDQIIRFQNPIADGKKSYEFLTDVLADEGFSFALRCNILRKVLLRNGLTKSQAEKAIHPVRELGNLRNLLAHTGKVGIIDQRVGVMHPRNVDQVINSDDFAELFRDFDSKVVIARDFVPC